MDLSTNNKHSPHIGYPSILPIAFGMLDYDSNEYRGTIAMVKI